MADRLTVFHETRRVGTLARLRGGEFGFEYSRDWLEEESSFAISASLPLESGQWVGGPARAFFVNLLPEGALRDAVARRLGLSPSNDFGLLEALGGECAGALSLLAGDDASADQPGSYELLDPEELAEAVRRFDVLPRLSGDRRPRLSLAGAQDKLPVRLDADGSLWLPTGNAASTHILKVPSRVFKHLPDNEFITTQLASALQLAPTKVWLFELGGARVAIVERYDRVREGDGIQRLHQEDFCQALGLLPGVKYEEEGGPTFIDALGLTRRLSTEPLVDASQILGWFLFCVVAGNSDGHGKNLSLLYRNGSVRLAPFYDLVCTRAYQELDQKLAMSVGGVRDPGQLGRRQWRHLAAEAGVGEKVILNRLRSMATDLPSRLEEVVAENASLVGASPVIERMRAVILKQCRRTLRLLDDAGE